MDLTAGFVLTGGRSRRMGRDKALLPLGESTLVERTAQLVRAVAGSVTLIGHPERYTRLGLPAVPDLIEDCGPVGGLHTALAVTRADWNLPADWNLVVACDMPGLTEHFLRRLIEAARASTSLCLVPETAAGLHPLCAVYHRRAQPAVASAIDRKCFKMHDLLKVLDAVPWPVSDALSLANVNTPLEWAAR